MSNDTSKARIQFSILMKPELKEQVEVLATANYWTRSMTVEILVNEALKARMKPGGKKR